MERGKLILLRVAQLAQTNIYILNQIYVIGAVLQLNNVCFVIKMIKC